MTALDHPEWQVRCPWCHASPGQRCTSPRGRRLAIPSHDARHTTWNAQTAAAKTAKAEDTE